MAYHKQRDLSLPEDASVIWRYMDLNKFRSMIRENAIFFSRADKQDDEAEGEYPEDMLAELERKYRDGIPSGDGTTYTYHQWHTQKEVRSRLISCWSMEPRESQRKWTAYTRSNESIAVRTTIGRLKKCFRDGIEPVWIGAVRYGEEENSLPSSLSKWGGNYWLYPFFKKKESYRWENEIRAIVNIAHARQGQFGDSEKGCYIKADLKTLIDSVWINPQSPAELKNTVGDLLDTCGFGDVGICQSQWDCLP